MNTTTQDTIEAIKLRLEELAAVVAALDPQLAPVAVGVLSVLGLVVHALEASKEGSPSETVARMEADNARFETYAQWKATHS